MNVSSILDLYTCINKMPLRIPGGQVRLKHPKGGFQYFYTYTHLW